MALTKAERDILEDTHTSVVALTTAIKGMNGKGGLLNHVDDHDHEFESVYERHNKLSRNFWMLVGVLVGSGVIGGSIWGALG